MIANGCPVEEEFRRAVERRDLAIIPCAALLYRSAVAAEIASLPHGSVQRSMLAQRALQLFEWADNVVRAHRSSLDNELQAASKTEGFLNAMQRAQDPHFLLDA